jgi:hypothetical protein
MFSSTSANDSPSSDEEILKDISHDLSNESTMGCNSNELFTSHEMEEGMGQSMDLVVGV